MLSIRTFTVSLRVGLGGVLAAGVGYASEPGQLASESLMKRPTQGFVENLGQWDAQARFLKRVPGGNVWVTGNGITYDLHAPKGSSQEGKGARGHVVRMEFVGSRGGSAKGLLPSGEKQHFFRGNDESRWITGAPVFKEVAVENVADGIDARWYLEGNTPRYDLIVSPGADPSKIAMEFHGATSVAIEDGVLALGTSVGDIRHKDLVAYQVRGGVKSRVECRVVAKGNTVRFEVGSYDRRRELVIDPLVSCTLLGGSASDYASDLCFDKGKTGILIVGTTFSSDFPTTVGAYDRTYGSNEAFVSKLSLDGSALLWSTFMGGSGNDNGAGVATLSSGSVVVTGMTQSTDFPLKNALDSTMTSSDVFLSRLSSDGSSLVFSTLWGGLGPDSPAGVAIDSNDRIIIAGDTGSPDFATTLGAFDTTYVAPEGFVTKFSPNGQTVFFSTYFGGSESERIFDVSVDGANRIAIGGTSYSADLPTTVGAHDSTLDGTVDGFAAKLNSDGSSLKWCSYLGGSAFEYVGGIASSSDNRTAITGYTTSSNFPTTPDAFRISPPAYNSNKAYVSCFDNRGRLLLSTFLGVSNSTISDVAFDSAGRMVSTGVAGNEWPTLTGSFQPLLNGHNDVYLTQLSGNGSKLLYSTLFGSGVQDNSGTLLIDTSNDRAYVLGASFGSPATVGHAIQGANAGVTDAFLAQFDLSRGRFTLSKSSVIGGPETLTGKVSLLAPAPPGGVVVGLTPASSRIVVPETVTIPEGLKSKTFTIKTKSVLERSPHDVGATFPGEPSRFLRLVLVPGGLRRIELQQDVTWGGNAVGGSVELTASVPASGYQVSLSSNSPSAVPSPATVQMGSAATAPFTVQTQPVAVKTTVTITAKLGGDTKTATLVINP